MEDRGKRVQAMSHLASFDSMMTHASDPRSAPEILALRERMRSWRYYDHIRTDQSAPARHAQVGTRTSVLASDGTDIAAALKTIIEIGDANALAETVDDAFPGSSIGVMANDGLFEIMMKQQGLLRPLKGTELSDGTLRHLLLVAALLTPRPSSMLVLNEPETSPHPSLLEPLARLIVKASDRSQIIVVSHAKPLVDTLAVEEKYAVYDFAKKLSETIIKGIDAPPWTWPKR